MTNTRMPSVERPWSKLAASSQLVLPNCSAYTFLRTNRILYPQDTALLYFRTRYTYAQMFDRIDAYARAFTALGVKAGETVTLALPTTPENIFAFYAINRIGAIADFIDLRSRDDVLRNYLQESGSRIVLACTLFAEAFLEAAKQVKLEHLIMVSPMQSLPAPMRWLFDKKPKAFSPCVMNLSSFLSLGRGITLPEVSPQGGDTAVILHTSGTTGTPKGVMLSNDSMNAMVLNFPFICDRETAYRGDILMNQVPAFLAYNILIATHMPLCARGTVRLLPDYRPDLFAANVAKFKPKYVIAGPADWGNFLEKPPRCRDFSFLHFAISGSDSMNPKTLTAVNAMLRERGSSAEILEGYGMTEIGSAAVVNPPDHTKLGSVGVPLPYNNVCIYDNESSKELGYNEIGEICMSGPSLMTGYHHAPDATKAVLRRHADGELWLHSGDLGYLTEDGYLYLEGRLKRIIVRYDGIKVSPFTVEKTITRHESVTDCCVVGQPDTLHGRGELPVAFITVKPGTDDAALLSQLQTLCETALAENYRPSAFRILDALPLTPNGKVDYRLLQTM